jgi:VIT1/CCC1 family predicted Fe2+/Mn2+ transporter
MNKELLVKFGKNLLSALVGVIVSVLVRFFSDNTEQVLVAFGASAGIASVIAAVVRTLISSHDIKKAT